MRDSWDPNFSTIDELPKTYFLKYIVILIVSFV